MVSVIPLDVDPTAEFSGPMGDNFLLAFDNVQKMLSVVAAGVLDAKVVDNEADDFRAGFMFEEVGCVFQLVIAVIG